MPTYAAPLRDINFVLHELLGAEDHLSHRAAFEDATQDVMEAILSEGAKFAEEVLAPLYHSSDEEGVKWSEDGVSTPSGFKEAYKHYVDNGWPLLGADRSSGGQGMPFLLACAVNELFASANTSWFSYPGLSQGAVKTIEAHGDDQQKETFLENLAAGTWTGTMCLTEPQCGSDLSLVKTKAEPQGDGSYRITGTKIFISAGDHDLTENIVHIVLARTPDAPAGTKGISLFIVPKFNVTDSGEIGERNRVHCASVEKKMGIHGSATCVLNFDGAWGMLIGPLHKGLACMFTFMNYARIGTGLQGLSALELSFQGALAYARDRLAMRSLSGPKNPDGPADPIIVHPDVRRMLLTQKAFAEGCRAFLYYLALQGDIAEHGSEEEARKANDLLALLTPIGKAFVTEVACEGANHGVQVFGGHGFIKEWGMEQIVRDTRITTLYEGTTGIQAWDLLGRKVLGSGGELLTTFLAVIEEFCMENNSTEDAKFIAKLLEHQKEWMALSVTIGKGAMENPDEAGAASVDYLMYSGYVTLAFFWTRMAVLARRKIARSDGGASFYEAKLMTAQFYFDRLLPRAQAHKLAIESGARSIMQMPDALFAV